MGLVLCTKSELRCLLQLHRFWINMYPQGNEGLYGSRVVCGQIRYRNWTCLSNLCIRSYDPIPYSGSQCPPTRRCSIIDELEERLGHPKTKPTCQTVFIHSVDTSTRLEFGIGRMPLLLLDRATGNTGGFFLTLQRLLELGVLHLSYGSPFRRDRVSFKKG